MTNELYGEGPWTVKDQAGCLPLISQPEILTIN